MVDSTKKVVDKGRVKKETLPTKVESVRPEMLSLVMLMVQI